MAGVSVVSVILILLSIITVVKGQQEEVELEVGFYRETCPSAETTVASVVKKAVASNSKMAAILLRLHFHDCFVEGCDGSILINTTNNTTQVELLERAAFGHQGVGGFDVIDEAKKQIEASCPGVVSCSDIVALAARDAIAMAEGPVYEVPTGRRDGRVSNVSLAADMPDVSDTIQQLKSKFFNKGLSDKDLVLLSGIMNCHYDMSYEYLGVSWDYGEMMVVERLKGYDLDLGAAAHTIGTTACFFMTKRLYDFFPGGGSDPSIRPDFLGVLKSECPQNGDNTVRIGIDQGSDQRFDIQILRNIRNGLAVLQSDAKLNDDVETRAVMDSYLGFFAPVFRPSFEADFVDAIIRMGRIGVKTGSHGEIRRVCSSFN